MLEKIRNLKVGYKLGLVAVLMGLPAVVFAFLLIQQKNQEIQAYSEASTSLDYLTPVRKAFEQVILHRGFAYLVLNGEAGYKAELLSVEPQVEAELASLEQMDAKVGRLLGTTETVRSIRTQWQDIKAKTLLSSAKESLDAHSSLSSKFLDLIRIAGDYRLIMDSNLDTYYLGNNLILQVPSLADSLELLRAHASYITSKGETSEADKNQLTTLVANARRFSDPNRGRIKIGLATAFKTNPDLNQKVGPALSTALSRIDLLTQSVIDNLVNGKGKLDEKQFFTAASDAVSSVFTLYDRIDRTYRDQLNVRVAAATNSEYINTAAVGLGLGVAVFLVWLVSRGVTRQVGAMTNLFSRIGIGDFTSRAEVLSEDEIGQATGSLNAMLDSILGLIQSREERDRIQESIQKLLEEISGLAEGDLSKQAEVTAEITGAIADAFNNMTDELRNVISKVQDTTLAVTFSANEVQSTTEHLVLGSESQAVQIVEASAAIDEMALSIKQVSANAASAAGVADSALKSAKLGAEAVLKTIDGMGGIRQQVQQTAKRIKRLGESSQEIGEIVQLINDIAERTTILALNASIQAAMAGDAGKGFAVVAAEVERLAEHSTDATKKISGLIKSIQTDTNEAIAAMEETTREVVAESSLANEAGQKLSEIEKVSTQLAEIIQSISMASKQQSRGSEGVAKSMSEISQVTQETAAGAKQAAVSIRKLGELADNLRNSLKRFKLPKAA